MAQVIESIIHKVEIFGNSFICGFCGKRLPYYYRSKENNATHGYYGNRGRYNFRGAKANFLRHIKKCEKVQARSV